MEYDPTKRALFFPGEAAPVADFSSDWERDQICAELSRLAYIAFEKKDAEKARLEEILAKAGFGKPECFDSKRTGAQAFGTVAKGNVYVAFRGTQITSFWDLLADALAIPVRWEGEGWVDWGFWRAYGSVKDEIEAWLGTVAGDLVLTGHSLGAAMATLMAALKPEARLVTFGSPRVGTKSFVDQFAAGRTIRRYVDCVDGVPGLPPPIGYVHLRDMIYIDHKGMIHDPSPGDAALAEDKRTAKHIYRQKYAKRPGNLPVRSGADHAPVNYISAALGRRAGP